MTAFIANEQLDELLQRSADSKSVTLRIDQFRDLITQAKAANTISTAPAAPIPRLPIKITPEMAAACEAYYANWQRILGEDDDTKLKADCWSATHAMRAMLAVAPGAQEPAPTLVKVGSETGFYFEFGRGTWARGWGDKIERHPTSGLAYVGGLTKDEQEELDQLISGYMVAFRGDARNSLTEHGIQQMTESEALARLKRNIAALERTLSNHSDAAPTPQYARHICTCAGSCKGPEGLGPGWVCALEQKDAKAS